MSKETIEFLFSGIGGDILFFVLGVILGGVSGYHIRNRQIFKQKAGDNSTQIIGNNNNK